MNVLGKRCHLVLAAFLSIFVGAAEAVPRCEGKLLRSEITERQEATLALLKSKKFAELESRVNGFLSAYTSNRMSDEELFYEFGAFDRSLASLTPLIQEWIERYPSSHAAHQAMALQMSAVAWRMRGIGFANETSAHQLDAFHAGLRAAQNWATRAAALHAKPILSYQQMMANAKAMRVDSELLTKLSLAPSTATPTSLQPRPDVLPLLDAGARIQADNVIVRNAYVNLLAPKWGGTLPALQHYAKPATHGGLSTDRVASVTYAATMELADDYIRLKQPDQALPLYLAASKICRLNFPLINMARIYGEQKRFAEALEASEAALAVAPEGSQALRWKAYALGGLGRHVEAVAILQRLALEGSPDVAYTLGEYYARGEGGLQRNITEARRLFGIAARGGDERAIKRLAAGN
jgi:tetratricopeptide (TPR) repeat protein